MVCGDAYSAGEMWRRPSQRPRGAPTEARGGHPALAKSRTASESLTTQALLSSGNMYEFKQVVCLRGSDSITFF